LKYFNPVATATPPDYGMLVPLPIGSTVAEKNDDGESSTYEKSSTEFFVKSNVLHWNDVSIMDLISRHGTPMRLTYLPNISQHIMRIQQMFRDALKRHSYQANYTYCYCTKSSHFRFVLDEVLKNDNIHLETSSLFDISILRELYRTGRITNSTRIICNGHKPAQYTLAIGQLIEEGFDVIPVFDSLDEIDAYQNIKTAPMNVGIRIAADEASRVPIGTSRLGVRYSDIDHLYTTRIQSSRRFRLKMLHFFVNTGIRNTAYYWSKLSMLLHKYCELRKICPDLDSINIGGGLPIAHTLSFTFSYEDIINQIVEMISRTCAKHGVPVPHLFTEFGSYTVGESGAVIYKVIAQKQQNKQEMWCMINGSFITQIPDTWATGQKFICLPINNWDKPRRKVLLGGLTCDGKDYYTADDLFLPVVEGETTSQYIGFFHTGAYQEALGGYGGVPHCLIPALQHVLVDRDEDGRWTSRLFASEQEGNSMLRLLGYAPT
jgi:arginine decarboxylase